MSICRTKRSRPAPSAVRTASSFRRTNVRARSRFARLVHAINSTQKEAPSRANSINRQRSDISSRSESMVTPTCSLSFGMQPPQTFGNDAHLRIAPQPR